MLIKYCFRCFSEANLALEDTFFGGEASIFTYKHHINITISPPFVSVFCALPHNIVVLPSFPPVSMRKETLAL